MPCCAAEYKYEPIKDELVETTLQNVSDVYPKANLNYDYTNINYIPIKIKFVDIVTSKEGRNFVGQVVKFVTVEDVYNGKRKIVAKDSIGTAKIEFLVPRGTMGSAGELIISDFDIEGLNKKKFDTQIIKRGLNLVTFVSVLRYTAGIVIPGTGILCILIRGGHAKIKPDKVFEIRYVP